MFDHKEQEPEVKSATEARDLDDDSLCGAVTEVAAQLAAGEARLLELIEEADRREVWVSWDALRVADWVSWLTGFSPRVAKEHVEVASRLPKLPKTSEALRTGEISFCQAKTIASTERPDLDDDLLYLAKQTTAGQLSSVVRAYHRATALNDLEAATAVHDNRYLNYFFDETSFVLRGRLGRDDGSVVVKALDAHRDKLFGAKSEEASDSPPRESDVRYQSSSELSADALVSLAEAALANETSSSGADRNQVVIHVDYDALTEDAPDARCEIEGAGAIPAQTARRLSCDSSVVWMLEKDGEPLSVGRKTRRVSTPLRRALKARDKKCCFPGCNNAAYLDAHHLRHWIKKGETSPANLRLFCTRHHPLLHDRGYSVEVTPDGEVIVRRPDGTVVTARGDRPRSNASELSAANRAAGLETARDPVAPWGAGGGFSLAYITDTYFFSAVRAKESLEAKGLSPTNELSSAWPSAP